MMPKDLKPEDITYQKGIIDKHSVFICGKDFYDYPIHSNIKRHEEIRKLISGQGEECTSGCLSDYDYIKIIKD